MTVMGDVPAWTVTAQVPVPGTDENGTFGDGWRITFKTAAGLEDHVFVLPADYRADVIRGLIQAKVDTHNDVAGLSG